MHRVTEHNLERTCSSSDCSTARTLLDRLRELLRFIQICPEPPEWRRGYRSTRGLARASRPKLRFVKLSLGDSVERRTFAQARTDRMFWRWRVVSGSLANAALAREIEFFYRRERTRSWTSRVTDVLVRGTGLARRDRSAASVLGAEQ